MLTRKPLPSTMAATHQRWDGLVGSRSPPVRGSGCGRAVAFGRAMVAAYPCEELRTCVPSMSRRRCHHTIHILLSASRRYCFFTPALHPFILGQLLSYDRL